MSCGPWWQAISDKKVTCSTFYIDDYGNEDTGDDNKQNKWLSWLAQKIPLWWLSCLPPGTVVHIWCPTEMWVGPLPGVDTEQRSRLKYLVGEEDFYDIIPFFLFILVIDNVLKQHLNIFDTGQDKLSSTAATVWCYIFELFKPNTKKI